ncbi:chemotaxis protein CheW [Lyngbya aestuarii]|uniref:chemotaxis protein CheW n=1 Tax=Lyngbya aestuarii TaxID=118322 RepID=UPI00403DEF78
MLMLLFYIGGQRYALSSQPIVEIVPLVELKKMARSPKYVAGLLHYRNQIIPVIDLCQLLVGNSACPQLSTRIIIVNYWSSKQITYQLGLIAERVTETLDIESTDFKRTEDIGKNTYSLGEIVTDEQGIIQCIRLDYLFSESQQRYLMPEIN